MSPIYDEAVAAEVADVTPDTPMFKAIDKGIDLNLRYGPDAESAFWAEVVAKMQGQK